MESKKIYVAIGKEVEERKSTLRWVLKDLKPNNVCAIYVHVPAKRIPLPISKNELEAFRAHEKEKVLQLLDDCRQTCAILQVPCETEFVEKDSITEGILELIYQLKIEKLVMGAAANHKYRRGMKLMSEKAKHVHQLAPDFCHIWFVCKDHLIYKRKTVTRQSPEVEKMPLNSSDMKDKKPHDKEFSSAPKSCYRHLGSSSSSAKLVERLYNEELRPKKVMKEEVENLERTLAEVELSETLDHTMSLESQVEKFNLEVKELEKKLCSQIKLSQKYRDEQGKLRMEMYSALGEAQELRTRLSQRPSIPHGPIFSEFSHLELLKATNDFDPCLKIGHGAYGSTYKGLLHQVDVAIKLLAPIRVKNHQEFDKKVISISKLQHPNLVSLIGACRKPWALIYEYLPCGTLEDRLIRQTVSTPSLQWQMRIRIAVDICSALIFAHSTGTVHGDLTPKKLLLDANFTCKISGFGVGSTDTSSDVFSFGIIVLYLLTGKHASLAIAMEVECALIEETFDRMLDPSAGEWPYVQAKQLAHMAVRCCDMNIHDRPDLVSDVWRVLAPMRASCSSLSSFLLASFNEPPHYFICPILQEIMEDPHYAADGFTYEAEAIRGWLESGHDTSPMTNMTLANHNLTPNRALRSSIQEWRQSTVTKWL